MTETWKPVNGYEGIYSVSDKGRIKRDSTDKILKAGLDKGGYNIVSLSKYNKSHTEKVHRLVAKAFIENIDDLPAVNHKDENKTNNNVENLEWCTFRYNSAYSRNLEKANSVTKKPIVCIKENSYEFFMSVADASKSLGISRSAISNCLTGRVETAGGFQWDYAM